MVIMASCIACGYVTTPDDDDNNKDGDNDEVKEHGGHTLANTTVKSTKAYSLGLQHNTLHTSLIFCSSRKYPYPHLFRISNF